MHELSGTGDFVVISYTCRTQSQFNSMMSLNAEVWAFFFDLEVRCLATRDAFFCKSVSLLAAKN